MMLHYYFFHYTCSQETGFITCECSNNSPASSIVSLAFTPSSINISQTGSTPNNTFMQQLLRHHLFFQHSASRPKESYTAFVNVVASDGVRKSPVATTTVYINFSNLLPAIASDGQVNKLIHFHCTYIYALGNAKKTTTCAKKFESLRNLTCNVLQLYFLNIHNDHTSLLLKLI